jgi:hypothetical protein
VVDLPSWDFGKLIGGAVLRVVLSMLHKMTGGNLDEFPVVLRLLSEITDEKQLVELSKELLDFVAKAFAAHNRQLDKAMVSKALNPIFQGKEIVMIKTIFEEKFDEGVAVGKAKAKVEEKAEAVLNVLRARFNRVPKEVEKTIHRMTDPIALDSWTAHAATCKSMKEFAEALR